MLRLAIAVVLLASFAARAQSVDKVLRDAFTGATGDGTLTSVEATLEQMLETHENPDEVRTALGIVRFLRSGEVILQRTYRHGGFNLPVQASMITGMGGVGQNIGFNPEPEPIDYDGFRDSIAEWIEAVRAAEQTLAEVGDHELKVRVPAGLARMDLNADGVASEGEQLWRMLLVVQTRFRPTQSDADAWEIAFDRGDVAWLRGYCNLCMALGEMILAHDLRALFERVGHVIYAKNVTPYEYLKGPVHFSEFDFMGFDVTDGIALIHLISFDVVEPERMATARDHIAETLRLAHEMWRWYDAETDDDREWIPSVSQRDTAIPNARITEEMHTVWLRALHEGEDLLAGRRLLRFWRGRGDRGISVRRFFEEPSRFDLVLWIQGSAAEPYLDEGEFTSEGLWRDMQDAFDRGVFRYMWWMN